MLVNLSRQEGQTRIALFIVAEYRRIMKRTKPHQGQICQCNYFTPKIS